jgi:hypothetical protein
MPMQSTLNLSRYLQKITQRSSINIVLLSIAFFSVLLSFLNLVVHLIVNSTF